MTKTVLNDLVNLENQTSVVNTINANNAVIETAFDNTLSRDGTAPNQMQNVLDMNSNQIINLPSPATGHSPVRLSDLSTLSGGISGAVAGTNIAITGPVISTITNPNFATSVTTPFLSVNLNGVANSSIPGDTFVGSSLLSKIFHGNVGLPVTAAVPTVGISRYEASSQDQTGGQSACLYASNVANNTIPGAQVNGITSKVTQLGHGDACAIYGVAEQFGGTGASYGGFFIAASTSPAGTGLFAVNPLLINSTGLDFPFDESSPGQSVGVIIQGFGDNLQTAGVELSASPPSNFDVGFAALNTSVKTTTFMDNSSGSINVLLANGGHTYGINLTNATFSQYAFRSPGFSVDGAGDVGLSGVLNIVQLTAPPAGGLTGLGLNIGSTNMGIYYGSGAPTLVATKGSLYMRSDGSGTSNRLYVNTDSSTTWTAVTTAA